MDGLCVSYIEMQFFIHFREADIIHGNTEMLNLISNDFGLLRLLMFPLGNSQSTL